MIQKTAPTRALKLKMGTQIILVAIEDVTEIVTAAENLANHTKQLEGEITERTDKLEILVKRILKRLEDLK